MAAEHPCHTPSKIPPYGPSLHQWGVSPQSYVTAHVAASHNHCLNKLDGISSVTTLLTFKGSMSGHDCAYTLY